MTRSEISQLDLSTGTGQERVLLLLEEMMEECSRLRSENLKLRSTLSEWEQTNSSASLALQEAAETVTKLTEKNLELRLMTQEAATRLSELGSTNELLWAALEEKTDGIGEVLADSEEEIVAEIKARQVWIRQALDIAGKRGTA